MKRVILLGLFLAATALGQSSYPRALTLCWEHPSLYVDGSEIQPGDLANTRLVVNRHDGANAFDVLVPMEGLPGSTQCSTQTSIPQPGTYTALAFSITIDDTSSDESNASVKKYTGKPLPATGLAAQ